MKTFLALFVLLFSSSVVADDISDFQIEGMSVGDSALIYFSKKQIKENTWDYYKNKEFTAVQNDGPLFFKTYDAVDFRYKTGDKKYKIESLSGILFYDDNIKDCYPKMNEIIKELKKLFNNSKFTELETYGHPNDTETNPEKKTKITDVNIYLDTGNVQIVCYDYSEKHGSQDHLGVSIKTSEYTKWLHTAYN